MKNYKKDIFLRAKKRVENLKQFYTHLVVYLLVNTGISVFKISRNLRNGETFEEAFFDSSTFILWLLWGIGLAFHAFSVFGIPLIMGKNWEENKIEQFMNEDDK